MKKIEWKDKFGKVGGKIYSGFLWVVQTIMMGMISYVMTMLCGVYLLQNMILQLLQATNFGEGAAPTAVDIGLMVGLPALFVGGFIFILLFKIYQKIWRYFTKMFDKLRVKYIKSEGENK